MTTGTLPVGSAAAALAVAECAQLNGASGALYHEAAWGPPAPPRIPADEGGSPWRACQRCGCRVLGRPEHGECRGPCWEPGWRP